MKLPAGASYTLFRWTSEEEEELKELAAVTGAEGSGDNNADSSSDAFSDSESEDDERRENTSRHPFPISTLF
jgi:hypothetical protein